MKLSQILGRILTDVALRQQHPGWGVCALVDKLLDEGGYSIRIDREFEEARRVCAQTDSNVYPVANEAGDHCKRASARRWGRANIELNMWRGQYGINRRKFVRDCWRWAKERGL